MLCKQCGINERNDGPRCVECRRVYNKEKARRLRAANRTKLESKNLVLLSEGKRVCSKCKGLKAITEFNTSMGNRKGKLNKICDRCLSEMYLAQGKLATRFDYRFWREKAYSVNSVAKSRLSRQERTPKSFDDLEFVCKPQDLINKLEIQSGACEYCRVGLTVENMSIDHVTPLSKGGTHSYDNLVLACTDCNHLKHTKTKEEFLMFIELYVLRFAK